MSGKQNAMTIDWAAAGFCRHRPLLMVAVRDSRHTYTRYFGEIVACYEK